MFSKVFGLALILCSIYCMSATLLHKGDAFVQVMGAILISFFLLLGASGQIRGKEEKPEPEEQEVYGPNGKPIGKVISMDVDSED